MASSSVSLGFKQQKTLQSISFDDVPERNLTKKALGFRHFKNDRGSKIIFFIPAVTSPFLSPELIKIRQASVRAIWPTPRHGLADYRLTMNLVGKQITQNVPSQRESSDLLNVMVFTDVDCC